MLENKIIYVVQQYCPCQDDLRSHQHIPCVGVGILILMVLPCDCFHLFVVGLKGHGVAGLMLPGYGIVLSAGLTLLIIINLVIGIMIKLIVSPSGLLCCCG